MRLVRPRAEDSLNGGKSAALVSTSEEARELTVLQQRRLEDALPRVGIAGFPLRSHKVVVR